MDKKLKTRWLSALRSGRYRQTGLDLRKETTEGPKYCCLGVLANIQGAKWKEGSPFLGGRQADANGATCYLLSRFAGGLTKRAQRNLSAMNDSGNDFKKIADYIAKQY